MSCREIKIFPPVIFEQIIPAHNAAVTANAFSPDGKSLVSYSCGENRLCFWQVSRLLTTIF